MIATDKRKAIYLLHQEGMAEREIARKLGLSRNTVRTIIRQGGERPPQVRTDKKRLEEELLRQLHHQCQGRIARVHEKLVEEHGIAVCYSTLTQMLRELGISTAQTVRCQQVPDEPGLEMQHDTTVYQIELAGHPTKLVASLLYLRYSKRRYLKFYRAFDRFRMKCFLHQALCFWGYCARQCIIDNTNLARLRGTGAQAVIHPEMEAFAREFGFVFRCHALKHPNRKAGEERSFFTVETNFLPGRTFQSLEDLNQQALAWSTERLDHKPQGKAKLIPAKAFEYECQHLLHLLAHLPAPYRDHVRGTDQYGFAAFGANYYWVPGIKREDVKLLEYDERLKIYQHGQCLAEYPLPPEGVKNQKFSPPGQPAPHQPQNRKRPTETEEKYLRALAPALTAYLDFALPTKGIQRHEFIRRLLGLSRRMSVELLTQSLERARKYRITSLETVERIALLYLQQGTGLLPSADVDAQFTQRAAYQEGCLTEAPDLSVYQDPPADNQNSQP
ncbi:MAG TPA: sigma factor-like helix-turn-helix DNA-binding protein [Terriglobales bacterium]|nr:sigma factor-like helix-turn-helix DNA-binding protein [Terriglobales bacterium]